MQMYSLLFEYAYSALQSSTLAEEAVQETFCIACEKSESLYFSPNPRGWLFNTLKYVIANMKRSCSIANRILNDYKSDLAHKNAVSDEVVELDILYRVIAETEEFKLLKEIVIDGKSHQEVAAERGITVAANRKRFQRAKQILREKLKK